MFEQILGLRFFICKMGNDNQLLFNVHWEQLKFLLYNKQALFIYFKFR